MRKFVIDRSDDDRFFKYFPWRDGNLVEQGDLEMVDRRFVGLCVVKKDGKDKGKYCMEMRGAVRLAVRCIGCRLSMKDLTLMQGSDRYEFCILNILLSKDFPAYDLPTISWRDLPIKDFLEGKYGNEEGYSAVKVPMQYSGIDGYYTCTVQEGTKRTCEVIALQITCKTEHTSGTTKAMEDLRFRNDISTIIMWYVSDKLRLKLFGLYKAQQGMVETCFKDFLAKDPKSPPPPQLHAFLQNSPRAWESTASKPPLFTQMLKTIKNTTESFQIKRRFIEKVAVEDTLPPSQTAMYIQNHFVNNAHLVPKNLYPVYCYVLKDDTTAETTAPLPTCPTPEQIEGLETRFLGYVCKIETEKSLDKGTESILSFLCHVDDNNRNELVERYLTELGAAGVSEVLYFPKGLNIHYDVEKARDLPTIKWVMTHMEPKTAMEAFGRCRGFT
jgi:hypothetical protein